MESKKPKKLRQGNCLQKMFFTYMLDIFQIGNQRPFEKKDYLEVDDHLIYDTNMVKFSEYYNKKKEKSSLFGILLGWIMPEFTFRVFAGMCSNTMGIGLGFILRNMILWLVLFSKDPVNTGKPNLLQMDGLRARVLGKGDLVNKF